MKIMILEMGPMADELKGEYPEYAPLFKELLKDGGFSYEVSRPYNGEPLPSLFDADGFLFTGSKHGVYENLPWMLETQDFIRELAAAKKPMIGICFGHQIMAQALGGEVIKSPKGWGLGVNHYDVIPNDAMGDLPRSMDFNAVHQDQVVKKPNDAEVFASSEFCEFAGLVYGGDKPYAMSLQAHPEFNPEFTKKLIKVRKGTSFPEEQSNKALASQSQPMNSHEWGSVIARFFKAHAIS